MDRLQREYKAFVRKLREVEPQTTVVPWTDRPYSTRKKRRNAQEGTGEEPAVLQMIHYAVVDAPFISALSLPLSNCMLMILPYCADFQTATHQNKKPSLPQQSLKMAQEW